MSEESHKKAADKVMSYTNNDFVTKFDETKDLPEEVMLHLLKHDDVRVHEIDIFKFLVKWHDYQAKELSKSILLIKELYRSIRYSLIPPRLLIEKVANCTHVDKEVFAKAFDCIYRNGDKPRVTLNLLGTLSTGRKGFSITCASENECSVSYTWEQDINACKDVVTSNPLKNGIYALKITCAPNNLFFRITDRAHQRLHCDSMIYNGYLIILNVYDNDIFLNIVENDNNVKLTVSATGALPFYCSFVTA